MPPEEELLRKKDVPVKETSSSKETAAKEDTTISPEEEEAFGMDNEAQENGRASNSTKEHEGKSKKDGPIEGGCPTDKGKE
jgi:hypothetical protein